MVVVGVAVAVVSGFTEGASEALGEPPPLRAVKADMFCFAPYGASSGNGRLRRSISGSSARSVCAKGCVGFMRREN